MKKTLFSILGCFIMLTANCQTQLLADTSVEASAAANNGVWTSTSSTYGTTWCSVSSCGTATDTMLPRTGTYYSWFGGTNSAEIGTMQQTFAVTTSGPAELKYWWKIALRDATDIFRVEIDGVSKYDLESNTTVFTTYQEKTISLGNLSAGSHTIRFYSQKTAGHSHNVALDDVALTVTSTLGTQNIGLSSGINIYTDSVNQTINISDKTAKSKAEIMLYDASGKLVTKNSFDISNNAVISTKGLQSGIYILNIKKDSKILSKKIMIK